MRQLQRRTRSPQSIERKRCYDPLTNTANANDVVRLLHAVLLAHALSLRKQLAQPSEKLFRERLLKIHYEQRIPHNIGISVIRAAISLPIELFFSHAPIVDNFFRLHIDRAVPEPPASGFSFAQSSRYKEARPPCSGFVLGKGRF